MTNLNIYKSNKVIEAGYKLNLNEQRLILMAIGKVNPQTVLSATDRFEVTVKEFAQHFHISEDKAYQSLKETAEQLFERYVVIDNPDPEIPTLKYTKTRWVSSIDYYPEMGKVSLYFAQRMLPYLSQLQGKFTFYLLENISGMTSIYGIRLYELLMQWKATGKREIEIEWLKKQFELDKSYDRMNNLKARVIEPAIKDINEHSNYLVSYEQRKTGRTVTHLIFTFAEKQTKAVKEKELQGNAIPKAKGKMINGVIESEINAKARPGESYETAAERIKREKVANIQSKLADVKLPRKKPKEEPKEKES